MEPSPTVFIGIGIYNVGPFIEKTVQSILNQTYPHFTLLLADDVSTDGTSEICQRLASQDSRIRYIRHENNKGHIENFNFILKEASGDFFAWVGHDDLLDPHFLETCLSYFSPKIDAVYTRIQHIDNNDVRSEISPYSLYHRFFSHPFLRVVATAFYMVKLDLLFYAGLYRLSAVQNRLTLDFINGQTIETDHLFMMKFISSSRLRVVPAILYFWRYIVKPPLYFESEEKKSSPHFRHGAVYNSIRALRKKLGLVGLIIRAFYSECEQVIRRQIRNGLFISYLLRRQRWGAVILFLSVMPFVYLASTRFVIESIYRKLRLAFAKPQS
jgi:glycosyltransferase involved in cell wall biosynthesis